MSQGVPNQISLVSFDAFLRLCLICLLGYASYIIWHRVTNAHVLVQMVDIDGRSLGW